MVVVGYILVDSGFQETQREKREAEARKAASLVVDEVEEEGSMLIPADGFKPGELCGDVLERCVASVEVVSENCDRNAIESEIREKLSDPLDNPMCRDIYKKMNQSCFRGCKIDLLALVTVPGSFQFDFDGKRNEEGLCEATGRRSITVRGGCFAESAN